MLDVGCSRSLDGAGPGCWDLTWRDEGGPKVNMTAEHGTMLVHSIQIEKAEVKVDLED